MKKTVIIVCLLIIILSSLIFISCAGVTWWSGSQYIDNNTKITEKIIGTKIPEGYFPIFAMEYKRKGNENLVSFLYNLNKHYVLLQTFPLQKSVNQKDIIDKFTTLKGKGHQFNNLRVEEDGKININGKEYNKYKISMDSGGFKFIGMAIVLKYPNKLFFFNCYAEENIYNAEVPRKFLEKIKLR